MKLLVTVGSTPFDQLIEAVDQQFSPDEFSITCQISRGSFVPTAHSYVRTVDSTSAMIAAADIVIAHGGSATVFELLEAGKSIVVVPNLNRVDKHQREIAHFVEVNHYASVCWDLRDLSACVEACRTQNFQPYEKQSFFMAKEVLDFFDISTR